MRKSSARMAARRRHGHPGLRATATTGPRIVSSGCARYTPSALQSHWRPQPLILSCFAAITSSVRPTDPGPERAGGRSSNARPGRRVAQEGCERTTPGRPAEAKDACSHPTREPPPYLRPRDVWAIVPSRQQAKDIANGSCHGSARHVSSSPGRFTEAVDARIDQDGPSNLPQHKTCVGRAERANL